MKHRDCGGRFIGYTIREHGYSFYRCEKCGHYMGGNPVRARVDRLLGIKVKPTVRRL